MARDIRNGYEVVKKWDDWALIDRGEYGYVAAHYPNYDPAGNITDWAHIVFSKINLNGSRQRISTSTSEGLTRSRNRKKKPKKSRMSVRISE